MATFAIMGDQVMGTKDKDFYGLVAIDAEGYVVWCYHMLFLELGLRARLVRRRAAEREQRQHVRGAGYRVPRGRARRPRRTGARSTGTATRSCTRSRRSASCA